MLQHAARLEHDGAHLGLAWDAGDDQVGRGDERFDTRRGLDAGIVQRGDLVGVHVEGDYRDIAFRRQIAAHAAAHDARPDESDLLDV